VIRQLVSIFSHETVWVAIAAILQGVAAIIAYSALRYSVTTFTKSLTVSNYSELDKMYFDLLKTAVEKPHLIDPNGARSRDQRREYDTYAFMVWNFLETIYDRCQDAAVLCVTWYPVIDAENCRHRKWFDDPENRPKFKQPFRDFIERNYPTGLTAVASPAKEIAPSSSARTA